jgi:hypothetical protein
LDFSKNNDCIDGVHLLSPFAAYAEYYPCALLISFLQQEVAQEDHHTLEERGFFPKDTRDFSGPPPERISYYNPNTLRKGASVITQSALLFVRQFLSFKRDLIKFYLNIAVQILLAFLTGIPYYTLGRLPYDNIKVCTLSSEMIIFRFATRLSIIINFLSERILLHFLKL